MQYVYVLRSLKDGKLYIGCAADVELRVVQHNAGTVRSTKGRRPFVLVYQEPYEDRREAFRKERYYKSAVGKRELLKKF